MRARGVFSGGGEGGSERRWKLRPRGVFRRGGGGGGWELEVSLEWEWGTNVLRARGVFMEKRWKLRSMDLFRGGGGGSYRCLQGGWWQSTDVLKARGVFKENGEGGGVML